MRAAARCTHERGRIGGADSLAGRPSQIQQELWHDSTTGSYIPAGAGKMRKHATRATVHRVDSTSRNCETDSRRITTTTRYSGNYLLTVQENTFQNNSNKDAWTVRLICSMGRPRADAVDDTPARISPLSAPILLDLARGAVY